MSDSSVESYLRSSVILHVIVMHLPEAWHPLDPCCVGREEGWNIHFFYVKIEDFLSCGEMQTF